MKFNLLRLWPGRKNLPRDTNTGGALARVEAERQLARTVAQTPYYERLGRDARSLRERNHIADNIRATLGGA